MPIQSGIRFHRLLDKLDDTFIHNDYFIELFIDIENILCVTLGKNDYIEDMVDVSLQSIILIEPHYHIQSKELENSLQFDETNYELRVIFHTWSNRHKKCDGDIYSRHVVDIHCGGIKVGSKKF